MEKLSLKDTDIIYEIINQAARAYESMIPDDCFHETYVPKEELHREMKSMIFFCWAEGGKLMGVMGFQPVKDAKLLRYADVLTTYQRKGIGTKPLSYLRSITKTKYLLVGTWPDATRAINFYKKHGFTFMSDKDTLFKKYWDIPHNQTERECHAIV